MNRIALLCLSVLTFVCLSPARSHAALDDTPLGVLQPSRVVRVGASSDGRLASVAFDLGDRVEAGATIARLEDRLERADHALAVARAAQDTDHRRALAALSDVENRIERRRELHEEGLVSSSEYDALIAERAQIRLTIAEAESQRALAHLAAERTAIALELTEVVAPIDGIVTARHLSPGERVRRSDEDGILEVSALAVLHLDVRLSIERWNEVRIGMPASVEVLVPGIDPRPAKVTLIHPIADAASDTFVVRLEVPNPDLDLPAGLRAAVRF